MKKNVSDHLAWAFLDNAKDRPKEKKFSFFLALSILVLLILVFGINKFLKKPSQGIYAPKSQSITIDNYYGAYELDYDFSDNTAKIRSLSIAIPRLNLENYKTLDFNIKSSGNQRNGTGTVKVSFINRRKETSSVYVRQISNSWKEIKIPLSEFNDINDWSTIEKLIFSVEEWNIFPKNGRIFIDNIEFSNN